MSSGSSQAVVPAKNPDARKYTEITRYALMGSFVGLAYWAWQCPCDRIFKCHRYVVVPILAAIFAFVTTTVFG